MPNSIVQIFFCSKDTNTRLSPSFNGRCSGKGMEKGSLDIANTEDSDQTAHVQSDQSLPC